MDMNMLEMIPQNLPEIFFWKKPIDLQLIVATKSTPDPQNLSFKLPLNVKKIKVSLFEEFHGSHDINSYSLLIH